MAKSMSHWVILSVLNYIRDTIGYYDQEKTKTYKSRKEINYTTIKIAVYGIGEIGSVVAKDLKQLGFKVEGWSRTQKNISGINCHYGKNKFKDMLKACDIHICLPLTINTKSIFNNSVFKYEKRFVFYKCWQRRTIMKTFARTLSNRSYFKCNFRCL